MSLKSESEILQFKVNLDEVECPSCSKTGTLVYAETMTKQGACQCYHCINPKCWGKNYAIVVIITEIDPDSEV